MTTPQSLCSCHVGHKVDHFVDHGAPSGLGRPGAGH